MFRHIVSKSDEVGRVRINLYTNDVSIIFVLKSIKFLQKTILSPAKVREKAYLDVLIFCVVLSGLFVRKSVS